MMRAAAVRIVRSASQSRICFNNPCTTLAIPSYPCLSFSSSATQTEDDTDATPSPDPASISVSFGVKKEDVHKEEVKRRRLSEVPISDVLKAKHSFRWVDPVIHSDATVQEAITTCIDGGLSGMMVVEEAGVDIDEDGYHHKKKKVVGLATSRDLLRIMDKGIKDGKDPTEIFQKHIRDFMTPITQVVYARPEETIGMCRTIMAKLGIKCIPILSHEGRVEGLITARDMSDYGLEAKEKGGKTSYLRDVSQRVGLSSNTSMADPPPYLRSHLALEQSPLFANIGVAELPHPFKTESGVGMNHRGELDDILGDDGGASADDDDIATTLDFGPHEFSENAEWSEDAHFVTTINLRDDQGDKKRPFTYMGVADGVGSWREYDVDPRDFSHKLMEECENILREASGRRTDDSTKFRRMIAPAEILAQAYERVKAENIIGSSTACVALFDNVRHQLHFSNLGDSGIIVLRHIDSDTAGTLKRNRDTPRSERSSDLRVAFVSQQQLRSFNHPYQLGWTGEELPEDEDSSFKTAKDSCTSSIHLRRGDIIIMGTDGLFDNVDIDDICKIALEWEQAHGFLRAGDIVAREKRWAMGNSLTQLSHDEIPSLAQRLCRKARELSLDSSIDSPFALLAKENDIMWSGGMPDDCTVVAMHVVGRSAEDTMTEGLKS